MKRFCLSTLLLFFTALLVDVHGAELRVGSKRFTESYILGEIITQAATQANEATVRVILVED